MRVNVEIRRFGLGPGSWHIYSAMGTSPEGDIYCGICDYSFSFKLTDRLNGARLIRYNPDEDKVYNLGDMQDVTGQRGRDRAFAQSKIHTPILFARDGKAYFGTHSVERDYVPDEYRPRFTEGYPGGHWISYDPSSGKFEDLGIAVPGESLMGLAIDPLRDKLYATTHKRAFLVEYDISKGTTTVRGNIGEYPTRTMAYLSDGKVYTFDNKGYLLRYDPESGTIERPGPRVPNGGYEADLITVFALCTDPSGDRFYGLSTLIDQASGKNVLKGGYLFEYSLGEGGCGVMKELGRGSILEETSTSESELYHAITFGADGKVYYGAPVKGKPVHLMSYDPKTGERRDHGEMWAESEGAYVSAVFAACTGRDGRLFWGGLLKSESEPNWDHEAVLMICDPKDF